MESVRGGRGTLIFIPLLFDALDAAEAGLEVAEEAMIARRPTLSVVPARGCYYVTANVATLSFYSFTPV